MIKLTPGDEAALRSHLKKMVAYERAYQTYSANPSRPLAKALNRAEDDYNQSRWAEWQQVVNKYGQIDQGTTIAEEVGYDIVRRAMRGLL